MKNEIFLVPYPFTDANVSKPRPALCLNEPRGDHEEVLFAIITSQTANDPQPTDVELDPQSDAGRSTLLLRRSNARLHRVFTINRFRVGRKIGELSPELQAEVAQKLRLLFDL
jgi:mRNA interferase MazF